MPKHARVHKHSQAAQRPVERRGSASSRGYDSLWRRAAVAYLNEHPACVICGEGEQLEVDHIVPLRDRPDLKYETRNLQTLCKRCHGRKTGRGH